MDGAKLCPSWDPRSGGTSEPGTWNLLLNLRADQLNYRLHEVYSTYKLFSGLVQRDPDLNLSTLGGPPHSAFWSAVDKTSGKPMIELSKDIDPRGILKKVGGSQYIHMSENEVKYFKKMMIEDEVKCMTCLL